MLPTFAPDEAHRVLTGARIAAVTATAALPPVAADAAGAPRRGYSTVTDLARLRGWSTSVPRSTAT